MENVTKKTCESEKKRQQHNNRNQTYVNLIKCKSEERRKKKEQGFETA